MLFEKRPNPLANPNVFESYILEKVAKKNHQHWLGLNPKKHIYGLCGKHEPCLNCDSRAMPWEELSVDKKEELMEEARAKPCHKIYIDEIKSFIKMFQLLARVYKFIEFGVDLGENCCHTPVFSIKKE